MNTDSKIICDAGATKSAWALIATDINGHRSVTHVRTAGINAAVTPVEQIEESIAAAETRLAAAAPGPITSVEFYGAGCAGANIAKMEQILQRRFPNAAVVVASDMLGAARAACGNEPGIVCILGTGSNSCYYNGTRIAASVPPLGWILGDEGSGTALGKRLVNELYKGLLDPRLLEAFETECNTSMQQIIERIYRRPGANVWLGSLVPFIARHITHPDIHSLVLREFEFFVEHNLLGYPADLPVHFIGSVAKVFSSCLTDVLNDHRLTPGRFIASPLEALV